MGLEGVSSIRNMQVQVAQPQQTTTQPVQPAQTTAKAVDNTEVATTKPQEAVTVKEDNGRQPEGKVNNSVNMNAENEQAASEKASNEKVPNNEQLKRAIEQLNKKIGNSEAVFGVHEDTNRVTIKIIDKDTKEVLKELPPEKTLDMIARVWEMAGILIDEKR